MPVQVASAHIMQKVKENISFDESLVCCTHLGLSAGLCSAKLWEMEEWDMDLIELRNEVIVLYLPSISTRTSSLSPECKGNWHVTQYWSFMRDFLTPGQLTLIILYITLILGFLV